MKSSTGILILLIILLIASRIPFLEKTPFEWDSVNLILGVGHFDILQDRPHPPGYIGYIAAGKAINAVVRAPHLSLLILNFIAGILLLLGIYRLGFRLFSRETGLIAAAMALCNTIVWFYGEITASYLAGAALWVWSVYILTGMRGEDSKVRIFLAGLILGLGGSIRPDVTAFLLPLSLYIVVSKRLGRKTLFAAGGFIFGSLVWVIANLYFTGGGFLFAMSDILVYASGQNSLSASKSLLEIAVLTSKAAFWMILAAGWVAPLALWKLKEAVAQRKFELSGRLKLLLWGILPLLIFQLIFHMRKPGYVLLYLPGMLILGAHWAGQVFRKDVYRMGYLAIAAAMSILHFLFSVGDNIKPGTLRAESNLVSQALSRINSCSRSRICSNDYYTEIWKQALETRYCPDSCAIAVYGKDYDWRRVAYLMPQYLCVELCAEGEFIQAAKENLIYVCRREEAFPPEIHSIIVLSEDKEFVEKYFPDSELSFAETREGVKWMELKN